MDFFLVLTVSIEVGIVGHSSLVSFYCVLVLVCILSFFAFVWFHLGTFSVSCHHGVQYTYIQNTSG